MAGEGGEGVKKRPRPGEDPKTTSPAVLVAGGGYISIPTGNERLAKQLKGDSASEDPAKLLKDAEHPAKNPKGHYINCCLDEMLEYNNRRWWDQSRFDVLQGKEDPISKAMRRDAGEGCERWKKKVANLKQHLILIGCSESWEEHVGPFRTENVRLFL